MQGDKRMFMPMAGARPYPALAHPAGVPGHASCVTVQWEVLVPAAGVDVSLLNNLDPATGQIFTDPHCLALPRFPEHF